MLRGGGGKSNYSRADIAYTRALLGEVGAGPRAIMVDCSHANSGKDHKIQTTVAHAVAGQVAAGSQQIFGLMLESFLEEGNQKHDVAGSGDLVYGQSITDACMGWEQTSEVLHELSAAARERRG